MENVVQDLVHVKKVTVVVSMVIVEKLKNSVVKDVNLNMVFVTK